MRALCSVTATVVMKKQSPPSYLSMKRSISATRSLFGVSGVICGVGGNVGVLGVGCCGEVGRCVGVSMRGGGASITESVDRK